jgi:hypothetical protein
MPNLLTRKEIASLINKSPQYIGVQIDRGHLVEKNKRIDTDNQKNKAFLSKFITKEVIKEQEKEKQKPVDIDNSDSSLDIINEPKKVNQANIDFILKQHDLKLKIVNIEKGNLDLDKKKGKLIEIQAAKDIMQRSVVVLSSQYRQNSKQFIIELSAKYNIPDIDLAGIQKQFDITINKAVSESIVLIKKECEIVVSEYSQTLNVGEHEND